MRAQIKDLPHNNKTSALSRCAAARASPGTGYTSGAHQQATY
jgi:hypothetical protein